MEVRVFRSTQPAPLARRLARPPARFLRTVMLMPSIPGIRREKPFAMQALALSGGMHGAASLATEDLRLSNVP